MSEAIADRIEYENFGLLPKLRERLGRMAQRFMLARELSALSQVPGHTIGRSQLDRRMAEIRRLMDRMPC